MLGIASLLLTLACPIWEGPRHRQDDFRWDTCAVVNPGGRESLAVWKEIDVDGLTAGSGVTAVSAGGLHTCAVVKGGVKM